MRLCVYLVAAIATIAASGCGKKGPPLAPLIRVPAAVETIQARRLGNEVFVSLTIPAANIDGSIPASVSYVEVYGYTGTTPPRGAWVEVGNLVARVSVPPSPLPITSGPRSAPATPAAPVPGLKPGGSITVVDTLTEDELVQGRLPEPDPRERRTALPVKDVEAPTHTVALPLRRFYVAYAFSPRGAPGPATGTPAEFVMHPVPVAPAELQATYTQTGVSLTWEPSGGLIGFLLDRALPEEEPPVEDLDAPEPALTPGVPVVASISGPTRYFVYRELEPDPLGPLPAAPTKDDAWTTRPPLQENPVPLTVLSFLDAPVAFGRARCYSVRSVRGVTDLVISEPSPPLCFSPVDVFPPAPPGQLAAVASEGAISLIWEPNTEVDLGGYLVLRGDPSDATLQPLTASPIAEARYRDDSAKSGKRYMYAVIAVDNRLPVPNWSAESNRVEETAR